QMELAACSEAAQSIPDEMRAEVCCIPPDDHAYRHLVANAWANGYMASLASNERALTVFTLTCRELPRNEVLNYAREACQGEARDLIDESWEAYCRGVV